MCVLLLCVSQVEQKKQHASITEAKQSTLEAQLQTEREALERKEKEVVRCSLCALCFFEAATFHYFSPVFNIIGRQFTLSEHSFHICTCIELILIIC